MALAKWARTEEPKPGSLKTRTEVDEWLLPHINKIDTIHTVFDRYLLFISITLVAILTNFNCIPYLWYFYFNVGFLRII